MGGLLTLVALLVMVVVARVAILRATIDAVLAERGFSDSQYQISMVGLTSTRIVDLRLGTELAATAVSLHYRPAQLTRLAVDKIVVAGLRVDLRVVDGAVPGPLARLLAGDQDDGGKSAAELPHLPPFHIIDGRLWLPDGVAVSLEDLRLTAGDDERSQTLAVTRLAIARESQEIALGGLAASIATDGAGPGDSTIRFTIAELSHAVPAPILAPLAVEGTVTREGKAWRLTATASSTASRSARGAATMKFPVIGSYDPTKKTAAWRISLPATTFAPGILQPGEIAPPLAVLDNVVGRVEGHLGLRWHDGVWAPEGGLRLDRFGFETGGVAIEDLSGRLVVAGDASQPVIRLYETRVTLAGGALAVDDATLRPLAETNRLVLQARGLDLGRLLAILDIDGVSGEGQIAGRIPLVLSGGSVAIEAGKLEAQGAGVLRIASRETAAALAQGGADTDLLLQALADFHYERLGLSIDKPLSGESRLTLNTFGHNPAVLDGHPFQVNVTVTTNLDKILGFAATGSRLSQDIIRAILGAHR